MLRLFLVVLLASAAFAAEEAVPTHLKVKATFTRPDKDGKPEVYAEPTVITVDGKQATIRVGSAEEGVVFTVTPKVNKDGTLTLEAATTESREAPPAPATSPVVTPVAPSAPARAKSNLPFFHGVLTKDKLFSIEDSTGKRQWVPLGRRIDGWTLKSYDEKREALTLSRLGQSVELVLHKAVIIDAPAPQVAVSRANTTITVKPGSKTLIGGVSGRTIELEAEILDVSK
jgi:type II secretory pathway component GspD/PulD (secretin)